MQRSAAVITIPATEDIRFKRFSSLEPCFTGKPSMFLPVTIKLISAIRKYNGEKKKSTLIT
jgi:hypothetical protein